MSTDAITTDSGAEGRTFSPARSKGFYNRIGKPVLDRVLAAAFFIALFPLYILVTALVAMETGFPVLYKAERGGYRGKAFRIYKFRTMVKNADRTGGGTTALGDPRITKVGRFLRRVKLDETPQLLNIMRGEMSFVGPRPELLRYTEQYRGVYDNILCVKPGITDYSSMRFINLDELVGAENADEAYEKHVLPVKNDLRLRYAGEVSFQTDVKIFFGTVGRVLQNALGDKKKQGK